MTSAIEHDVRIQLTLSAALRGEVVAWPTQWSGKTIERAVIQQALYHGVAGLLNEQVANLIGWPQDVLALLRDQALAQAMWEMRHKLVVADFLTSLGRANIAAIVLKGTALAYDIYKNPATRTRGDSDILVEMADLGWAREILRSQGFRKYLNDGGPSHEMELQETWHLACIDGTQHYIDLHWQTMNFPALDGILSFADCLQSARRINTLCAAALSMSRSSLLLHACAHRGKHLTVPYFSDGSTFYGGDRLIWAKDIDLLASALSEAEWAEFCGSAARYELSPVCLDGLQLAQRCLATSVPDVVLDKLAAAPANTKVSVFLLHSGRVARAWADFMAVKGWRQKISYASAKAFPHRTSMQTRYPTMKNQPLIILYFRRWLEFLIEPNR